MFVQKDCRYFKRIYKNLRFTPGFHEPPKDQHVSFHQARWEGLHEVIFLKHTENVSNDPIQNQIL